MLSRLHLLPSSNYAIIMELRSNCERLMYPSSFYRSPCHSTHDVSREWDFSNNNKLSRYSRSTLESRYISSPPELGCEMRLQNTLVGGLGDHHKVLPQKQKKRCLDVEQRSFSLEKRNGRELDFRLLGGGCWMLA